MNLDTQHILQLRLRDWKTLIVKSKSEGDSYKQYLKKLKRGFHSIQQHSDWDLSQIVKSAQDCDAEEKQIVGYVCLLQQEIDQLFY